MNNEGLFFSTTRASHGSWGTVLWSCRTWSSSRTSALRPRSSSGPGSSISTIREHSFDPLLHLTCGQNFDFAPSWWLWSLYELVRMAPCRSAEHWRCGKLLRQGRLQHGRQRGRRRRQRGKCPRGTPRLRTRTTAGMAFLTSRIPQNLLHILPLFVRETCSECFTSVTPIFPDTFWAISLTVKQAKCKRF